MDLTLYLGRTLSATPIDGVDGGGSGGGAGDAGPGGAAVELGKFPSEVLTAEAEFVKSAVATRDDLTELAKARTRYDCVPSAA